MSKPSAAESKYLDVIRARMAEGDIRSVINDELATDLHHPLGNAFWETGKGLKAHDWFVIPLTTRQHRERSANPQIHPLNEVGRCPFEADRDQ